MILNNYISVVESKDWMQRHVPGKGGVLFDLECQFCKQILKHDLRDPVINDKDWKDICSPHIAIHSRGDILDYTEE